MGFDSWLAALCLSRAGLTLVFLSYAACLPVLREQWGLSAKAAGSIAGGFQLGYAASLFVFSRLAERIGARRVFLLSAVASAATALAFALLARDYASGLALYALVGLAQGGTYTTAIMLVAERYPPARRGSTVGWLIASSSLGYAASLFLTGAVLPGGGYRAAFLATGLGPAAGALVGWLALRGTPNRLPARHAGPGGMRQVLASRDAVRLIAGYTSHTWELLGMWAWAPAFLAASWASRGALRLDRSPARAKP